MAALNLGAMKLSKMCIRDRFYTSFEIGQVVYGPVFYVHMIYTYICVLAGMGVVLMRCV